LTPDGRTHPIFQFRPDERGNKETWDHLQELFWYAEGYKARRQAEVLAVHPRVRRADKVEGDRPDREAALLDRHPLVVQQFVGAGRCLFFGFNETWRWGKREDLAEYNRFWIQTVRYLARSRLGRIELLLDRQTPYRRGEPIKITVRFPEDDRPPEEKTDVVVVAERRPLEGAGEAVVQRLKLAPVPGARATFETVLATTPEGLYKFWLAQPVAKPLPHAECEVYPPPGEMFGLRLNQAELETAAEQSRGRFYNLADAERLLDDLPSGSRVTLNAPGPPWLVWNHVVLFAVAILLLTTEWLLRKQQNLL
jgi:hypothetical protein